MLMTPAGEQQPCSPVVLGFSLATQPQQTCFTGAITLLLSSTPFWKMLYERSSGFCHPYSADVIFNVSNGNLFNNLDNMHALSRPCRHWKNVISGF